ncbi:MAG: tyrosine-type recombinase/integrase [Rhodocyclales bacterium]|nr:tyrosine-type recombinase/integrase [Rhodocyclales bacterium]
MLDPIEKFLTFKRHNRGRSERTVQVYRLALGRLAEFLAESGREWRVATHDDLLVFSGIWLHRKGLKDPLSRRPHVAAVREFFRWAAQMGMVANSPAEAIPYPRAGLKLPQVLTLANAEKIMWAPDFATFEGVRDGAMLGLLIGCGLRVSGLVALNQGSVIQEVIDGRPRLMLHVTEKGNKQRRLPVPEQADLLLRLYLDHPALKAIDCALPDGDRVLFVSVRNRTLPEHEYRGEARRLRRRAVLMMVKKYGRDQGIPEDQLHPHALRHLYGTELREDEVDLITRQRLMGHADPKTTAIYDHLAMRKVTRDVDRANPLAKIRTPASDLLQRLKGQP